jgi:2-polyprenyl-6-methoxyphenol hydroxylase-like FAD-dependent oxidoreductase
MRPDLLKVGAGVAGLTLAVKLAKHDFAFTIYDREDEGVELGATLSCRWRTDLGSAGSS